MTNEPISQEEIDALLRGMSLNQSGNRQDGAWETFRQAMETAMQAAWTAAPALLGTPAETDPVEVTEEPAAAAGEAALWGRLPLGEHEIYVMVPGPLAESLLELVLGGEVPGAELEGAGAEALAEILSQLLNKAMQKLLAQAGRQDPLGGVSLAAAGPPADQPLVTFRQSIRFQGGSSGTLFLAFPQPLAEELRAALSPGTGGTGAGTGTARPSPAPPAAPPRPAPARTAEPAGGSGGAGGRQAAAPPPPPAPAPAAAPEAPVSYQPARFEDFGPPQGSALTGEGRNLDLLLDVTLQVTVELGRTRRQIRDVLSLAPGSVLELEKLAGEPVEVLVNGKLIARGEVVVIDEHFGVRITDIISPAERAASLGR